MLYYTVFRRAQWVLLLIASTVFYLLAGPKYMVYIIVTALVTYGSARKIQSLHDEEERETEKAKADRDRQKKLRKEYTAKRKRWLLLDLFINIGILATIKYLDFFLQGVTGILARFGIEWSKTFAFVLPLGISFYTFMVVGYILDIYWKRYKAEKNFFKLFLFTSYFPHITQGPISRYNKLAPQFLGVHRFDYDRLCKGLQLMLWGYFEKMVIADRLSVFYGGVYTHWDSLRGMPLILAIIFLSLQLYLDFQGCMDIGRGVSQTFGIDLEVNFARPYFSKNMPEFWRRWHITLGAWFKDYLLYPVSISKLCKSLNKWTRKKWGNTVSRTVATIIPAACVWVITGLWHGAATRFLLWGAYHGVLIIGGAIFQIPFQKLGKALHIKMEAWSFDLFRMIRTFILSAIGRIFFVSDGFKQAVRIIWRTFDIRNLNLYTLWDESLYTYGLDRPNFILALVLIALIWGVGIYQEKGVVIRDWIAEQNLVFRWVLYLLLIFGILLLGVYGEGYNAANFIYQQF